MTDIVERMRAMERDHAPDGWPAVQMRDVSALLDEIERLRAERDALLALLWDWRWKGYSKERDAETDRLIDAARAVRPAGSA